jgi:flagellar hook protein FlgE
MTMQISGSAFTAGISTFQSGQQRVERAAGNIASAAVDAPARVEGRSDAVDTARKVELKQGQYQAEIGAKVVKTADEVLGTLIDIRA